MEEISGLASAHSNRSIHKNLCYINYKLNIYYGPLFGLCGSEITPTHFADTRGPLLIGVANLDPVRFRTRKFRYRLYEQFIQPSLPSEQISRVIFEIRYLD